MRSNYCIDVALKRYHESNGHIMPKIYKSDYNRVFDLREGKISYKDLFKLNLGFWLRGQRDTIDSEKKETAISRMKDETLFISSIFKGIVSLRFKDVTLLNDLMKWSFEWYFIELAKKKTRLVHKSPSKVISIVDYSDPSLLGLKVINRYCCQALGISKDDCKIVAQDVSFKADVLQSCFPKDPSVDDFHLLLQWFIQNYIYKEGDETIISIITDLIKENTEYATADGPKLAELAYAHSEASKYCYQMMKQYQLLLSIIYTSIMTRKTVVKTERIFDFGIDSRGLDHNIHIINKYGSKANDSFTINVGCSLSQVSVENIDKSVWNTESIIRNTNILGLGEVELSKFAKYLRENVN